MGPRPHGLAYAAFRQGRTGRCREDLNPMWLDALGWTATAFFASSYFFKKATALRGIQAAAALLWILYGLKINSGAVVFSNMVVGLGGIFPWLRLGGIAKTNGESGLSSKAH